MKGILKRYTYVAEENALWLVGLTDIMTNLMLFFLILYVFAIQGKDIKGDFIKGFDPETMEAEKKEEKGKDAIQKMKEKETAEMISRKLNEAGLADVTEVEMTSRLIRINLSAPVLFYSGGDELGGGARELLKPIGYLLKNLEGNDIVIEGHTDSVPIKSGKWKTNWQLSAARANAVMEFLNSEIKLPNERMVAAAYGEYRPVAGNDTARGRAKNRRIEIVVTRKEGAVE